MTTIQKPAEEVYSFWRDLTNAPKFMGIIDRVEVLDDRRSLWHTREIRGRSIDYEAEIVDDTPNNGFRWESVEGTPIKMRGAVRFKPAPADRGTIVIASVIFGRGEGGGIRGRLASPLANYTIHRDLARLKQLLETGEIPTTEGQPAGSPNGEQYHAGDSPQTALPRGGEAQPRTQEYGADWS